jgi:hypothetical protein
MYPAFIAAVIGIEIRSGARHNEAPLLPSF